MSFHKQSFQQRLQAMGDEAEGIFEEVWPTAWERFGHNRPRFSMAYMQPFLRYVPDYATSNHLIEVMGLGRDRIFKMKLEKLQALQMWNIHHPTRLFVWDSHGKRWTDFSVTDLEAAMASATVNTFPEGKAYFAIDVAALPGEWKAL